MFLNMLMPRLCLSFLLLRDCISNWLRDCLLHGVTMGFCPWSSLFESSSINFLDDASEPTHTSANLQDEGRRHIKVSTLFHSLYCHIVKQNIITITHNSKKTEMQIKIQVQTVLSIYTN